MNKKSKIIGLSTFALFLTGISTTLGITLTSCSKKTESVNSGNFNYLNVSSNIQQRCQSTIDKNNISYPDSLNSLDSSNSNNGIILKNYISNAIGIDILDFTLKPGSNFILVNLSDKLNNRFDSKTPENTESINDGLTLKIKNIEWAVDQNDDLDVLLRRFHWWNIDLNSLQKCINNNKIFSSYIINQYSPNEMNIDKIIFNKLILYGKQQGNDPKEIIQNLVKYFEYKVDFTQESNGSYSIGTLQVISKSPKYRFIISDGTIPSNMSISDDRMTLSISNLDFPTYILSDLDNSIIFEKIQAIFKDKPIETKDISTINNAIYNQILNKFGNVKDITKNVPVLSLENVTINTQIDNENSITYKDFETPATITIDLNGSNIKTNMVSDEKIEYLDNGKILIHIDVDVTPFKVEIQNPNLSSQISNILDTYQIERPDDLANQKAAVSKIFEKINQSYELGAENSDSYDPIEHYITPSEVTWSCQYSHSSNKIQYYNLIFELNEDINKEFEKLDGVNVNSIEIKDASSEKEHYKNKILIIKNINFYMPYNLIDTDNLINKIQQTINELEIISYKDFNYYKDVFFQKVFGNILPSDKATVEVGPNSFKITINQNYDYMFDVNGYPTKIFETNVEWFNKEYIVTDETIKILKRFINDNNIQKNTNISIYSEQLLQTLFGNNVYNNDVAVEIIPKDPNDYENTSVQFAFTVKPDSNLTYVLGELNNENAANVNLVSGGELIITVDVLQTTLEIDANLIKEQFIATIEQLNITNFVDTIKGPFFLNALGTNIYNELIKNNSYIPSIINLTQFNKNINTLQLLKNGDQIKILSSNNNLKFLYTTSSGTSSLSNVVYIDGVNLS